MKKADRQFLLMLIQRIVVGFYIPFCIIGTLAGMAKLPTMLLASGVIGAYAVAFLFFVFHSFAVDETKENK